MSRQVKWPEPIRAAEMHDSEVAAWNAHNPSHNRCGNMDQRETKELLEEPLVAGEAAEVVPGLRQDLAVLMKVRLNTFVLVTTLFGFLLASKGGEMRWMQLVHTLIGTAAAAFGSAAFNQLMEVDLDARMSRTANRPLPSRRMDPLVAFGIGWLLSAIGIIHLTLKVNVLTAYLAAGTIAIYVFVYTPLKRFSSTNTLVGAIPGAIPPMIGWVGAGKSLGWEAWFLFTLLFLWQLPHFIAISWLCREEYEEAGYEMWSNGDVSGKKSGMLAAIFALILAVASVAPTPLGFAHGSWAVIGPILAIYMAVLAVKFFKDGERTSARRLFFSTLIYLPVALGVLLIAWKN